MPSLKQYFDEFAFQVMNTKTFLSYLDQNLLAEDEAWKAAIGVDNWVYGEGIPENIPVPESNKFKEVDAQLEILMAGNQVADLEVEGWSTPQWLHFIRSLNDEMNSEEMSSLDQTFNFTNSGES